jgi:cell division protein FtsB
MAGMLLAAATIAAFSLPIIVGIVLAMRFVRANEQRTKQESGVAAMERRIADLEHAIVAMRRQLEQVAEGQRFTTKVTTEPRDANAEG